MTATEKHTSLEYREGRVAFSVGELVDNCPYESKRSAVTDGYGFNDKRNHWIMGWYDAKFSKRWPGWCDEG